MSHVKIWVKPNKLRITALNERLQLTKLLKRVINQKKKKPKIKDRMKRKWKRK